MSFFDDITNKADLALRRTRKNIEAGWTYASNNPVEAALIAGSLIALTIYMPAPVILTLCFSMLALLCVNLFKDATFTESVSSAFGFN